MSNSWRNRLRWPVFFPASSSKETKKALEKKTAELSRSLSLCKATIELTADGLLVTDRLGRVLYQNQLYLEMWPIPEGFVENAPHQAIVQYGSRQLKDPEQYLSSTDEIYERWPTESFDLLEFRDGRVFERYTKAKILEEQNMVRVWSLSPARWRRVVKV